MTSRDPGFPWLDGRPTHLPCGPGDVPEGVVIPGDPARVDRFSRVLDDFVVLGQRREFRYGVGRLGETRIGVCSTGIGGPSTEIAMVELFNLGARAFVRAGGMAAIVRDLGLGEVVGVERVVRNTGAARVYAPEDGDLDADPIVLDALTRAGAGEGICVRRATIMSTDSYYLGQGRPAIRDGSSNAEPISRARGLGAQGLDMETETVFAVARYLGAAAGAVLAVHANRAQPGWLEAYDPAQDAVVSISVHALSSLRSEEPLEQMDRP